MANESYYTRQLRKELDKIGLFRKIATGMQSSGIPDLLGCVMGRFVCIEAKICPNTPTALQEKFLTDTVQQGGIALLATYHRNEGWALIDWEFGTTTKQMTNAEVATWLLKRSSLSTNKTLSI